MAELSIDLENWMNQLNNEIGEKSLKDIVIPGSHDAGTYDMSFPGIEAAQTQKKTIQEQLEAGSRYVDLRAKKWSDGEYWINHGIKWTNVRLDDAVNQIKAFAQAKPKEIVIVTLLLDGEDSTKEYGKVETTLKDQLIANSKADGDKIANTTLNDIYKTGRNVLLSNWGDVNQFMHRSGVYDDKGHSSSDLETYLLHHYQNMPSNKMWIWHMVPVYYFAGPSLETSAGYDYQYFKPKFEKGSMKKYGLNIVNLNFVGVEPWGPLIIAENTSSRVKIPRSVMINRPSWQAMGEKSEF